MDSNTQGQGQGQGQGDVTMGVSPPSSRPPADLSSIEKAVHRADPTAGSFVPEELEQKQRLAIQAIRQFLQSKTSFDVLPVSYRVIVFETSLLVKRALNILLQNSIVSAPLWNSKTARFAGLLTSNDFINVIQYYSQNPDQFQIIDNLNLDGLRDIEKVVGNSSLETISIHPFRPLYDACVKMLESSARRIPLIEEDEDTHREIVVSVLTQYRILKFVSMNCRETKMLLVPLRDLNIGTTHDISAAKLETPIMDVINLMIAKGVTAVPIVDDQNRLINVYEAVDVLTLIKGGMYTDLTLSVGEALLKRSDDFEGVYTCTLEESLYAIFETIRKARVHRLFIVDDVGQLLGVLTLSDMMRYMLFST